jgi:hypothetical protein
MSRVALLALEYMVEQVCAGCSSTNELSGIMANSGALSPVHPHHTVRCGLAGEWSLLAMLTWS